MQEYCAECGYRIRFEVKHYNGHSYDSRCHRAIITRVFVFLNDAIQANWMMYRIMHGENRDDFRDKIRSLIVEHRELSY